MKRDLLICLAVVVLGVVSVSIEAAELVPTEIQQPGTQPGEIGNLESPDKCDNCHGGYNLSVEPAHNWRGSMMANAGRDPIFWATLAVAEQDFDGAGDLCIRCHSASGWLAGRSTPTDGSGLAAADSDGVDCDFCHKLTNPNDGEHLGVMNAPFIAHDGGGPPTGYYGSGMTSVWGGAEKLGPYADTVARHQFMQSEFHRSPDLCGSCHDVSNPAVGDLAPNAGAQGTADPVVRSGVLAAPVDQKAAFNNFPYQYGIVERTFSEFKSGLLSQTLVADYLSLPAELQAGAIKAAYESAITAGTGGDYADGTPRYFTCQTCHLRPVNGPGCNKKGAEVRNDLPLHDMTGGNYWMPEAIQYLDNLGKLRLGGGLTGTQVAALNDGKTRALKQLSEAATLEILENPLRVKIVNLTGHKLISGYPEGRRMWLNIKWYDGVDPEPMREDGAYGPVNVVIDGVPTSVDSLIDLYDPNTKIYEAHYAMTPEWAALLITPPPVGPGLDPNLELAYDRVTGEHTKTLGELAAEPAGFYQETFHFVLNDYVAKDNRIPPYGMAHEAARLRNALPVPDTQYRDSETDETYDHFDEFELSPPPSAVYANIELKYQPTSWEYIQFLYLANKRQNVFLADEGVNLLEAWLNTGMAAPYTMASTTWGTAPTPPTPDVIVDSLTTWSVDKKGVPVAPSGTFKSSESVGIVAHTIDGDGGLLVGAQVFLEIRDSGGAPVTSLQGFTDENGEAIIRWKTPRRQAAGTYSANVIAVIKSGYDYNSDLSVVTVTFAIQ